MTQTIGYFTAEHAPAGLPDGNDLGAELRRRRGGLLARLGGYAFPDVAAGEADELLRELDAINLCLCRLPQVEAHAERMAALSRSSGLLLLADTLDAEFPGNSLTARLRSAAEAV